MPAPKFEGHEVHCLPRSQDNFYIYKFQFSVCAHKNDVYITGGHSNSGTTVDAVSVYFSNINQWSLLASMHYPRERHGSASVDGNVYVAGSPAFFLQMIQRGRLFSAVRCVCNRQSRKNAFTTNYQILQESPLKVSYGSFQKACVNFSSLIVTCMMRLYVSSICVVCFRQQ